LVCGEPDDAKVSRPVRWGADGKGEREPDLAGGLPYVHLPGSGNSSEGTSIHS
jgi:hypothetical protein